MPFRIGGKWSCIDPILLICHPTDYLFVIKADTHFISSLKGIGTLGNGLVVFFNYVS